MTGLMKKVEALDEIKMESEEKEQVNLEKRAVRKHMDKILDLQSNAVEWVEIAMKDMLFDPDLYNENEVIEKISNFHEDTYGVIDNYRIKKCVSKDVPLRSFIECVVPFHNWNKRDSIGLGYGRIFDDITELRSSSWSYPYEELYDSLPHNNIHINIHKLVKKFESILGCKVFVKTSYTMHRYNENNRGFLTLFIILH